MPQTGNTHINALLEAEALYDLQIQKLTALRNEVRKTRAKLEEVSTSPSPQAGLTPEQIVGLEVKYQKRHQRAVKN